MRFTKGKHAFIVATHVDRAHIHNHIIFNSTTLDSTRKFRDFRLSGLALARLSDIVCLEHRLSVIIRKPYGERQRRTEYPEKKSQRDEICEAIDAALARNPKDFRELIEILQEADTSIKMENSLPCGEKATPDLLVSALLAKDIRSKNSAK